MPNRSEYKPKMLSGGHSWQRSNSCTNGNWRPGDFPPSGKCPKNTKLNDINGCSTRLTLQNDNGRHKTPWNWLVCAGSSSKSIAWKPCTKGH